MRKEKVGKRRILGFFSITSRALMSVAAGLLLLSYLSMFFDPSRAWFMTIFGLLYAPLALLNLLLLLWAIFRKSGAAFIPLAALIPSLFIVGRYVGFSSVPDSLPDVKVLSYNVGRFSTYSEKSGIASPQECRDSVAAFLKSQNPDIICLQEVAMSDAKTLKKFFSSRFRGYNLEYYVYTSDNGCYGNVTLSKYPISNRGKLDFGGTSNLAIFGDCKIGERSVRVYNCHFQSYSISLPHLVKSIRRGDRETLMETETKMRKSIVRRPKQVKTVMEDIEACPLESMVVGDFNDNPMSYTYYRLRKGHKDSFVEAGNGLGATYSYLWPLLRIDYILFPKSFEGLSHKPVHKGFSDHYPILAGLSPSC